MDELTKAVLKTDFTAFIRKTFEAVDPLSKYLYNWHIGLIGEYLLACQRREIKRLIINIPPRHLKSISVAVAFPAWLLGQNPYEQIMCASYSLDLSKKHSMDCRLVLQSDWYKELFPDTTLVDDQNTQTKFVTTKRGYRIATSVGGTVTGAGGNFLIVDDPINQLDSISSVEREKAINWFDQSFTTRLNDPKNGCIIVIMQRLHDNDLTGHLLRKGGWDHLLLPLIAEQDEVLEKGAIQKSRTIGDLLHPERIDEGHIKRLKIDLGSLGFAGQYQQRPTPKGGEEFKLKDLCYYESLSHTAMNKYILIDPANSKRKQSDYTAAWVIGLSGDRNYYKIDLTRDKLSLKERCDLLFKLHETYKPLGVGYQQYGMEADIEYIQDEMSRRNYRFHITPVTNKLGKLDRIKRLSGIYADKRFYMPKQIYKTDYEGNVRDVIHQYIHEELLAFPNGLHDDMLDALAMLFDMDLIFPSDNSYNYERLYSNDQWSKL